MEFEEKKKEFLQTWGTFGSKWGINKAMAQIHALLLIAPEPLCTDDIMEELHISRGNVNMNVRNLLDWGLVSKVHKEGERKEYFEAEKDIWKVISVVTAERRKREIEPVINLLQEAQHVDKKDKEQSEFKKVTGELLHYTELADNLLETLSRSEQNWFLNGIRKLFYRKKS
jgi:DNA-binding transcriptional regulator GbsR (MarR family)